MSKITAARIIENEQARRALADLVTLSHLRQARLARSFGRGYFVTTLDCDWVERVAELLGIEEGER